MKLICSYKFCLYLCRTQYLEKGPTSPVTSAWPSSTVRTAAAGARASWVHCSAASPCVKSSITQTWSARWRRKVSSSRATAAYDSPRSYFFDSRFLRSRFGHRWPAEITSKEQRRRRRTAELLHSHQQSASTSQISARLLSGETPVQVGTIRTKLINLIYRVRKQSIRKFLTVQQKNKYIKINNI